MLVPFVMELHTHTAGPGIREAGGENWWGQGGGSRLAEPHSPGRCPGQQGQPAEKQPKAWDEALHWGSLHTQKEYGCCFTATFQTSSKKSPAALANLELCKEENSGKQGFIYLSWHDRKTIKPAGCWQRTCQQRPYRQRSQRPCHHIAWSHDKQFSRRHS